MLSKQDPKCNEYLNAIGYRLDPVQQALVDETKTMEQHYFQVPCEQAKFMQYFVKLIGAKKAIEIGVFTGLSALCTAQGMPEDGKLYALDTSEEWTNIGKKYWEQAGVANKIELMIGPGLESAESLCEEHEGTFDFAFIDADKINYSNYYEVCLKLLRPGGVILVDNTLWKGLVWDPENNDPATVAIREVNEKIHADERVDQMMLTMGDGIHMAIKL